MKKISKFTTPIHEHFMSLAREQKKYSHDLRTQTYAIIVNQEMQVIGSGTNKLPFEINDNAVRMFQDQTFLDYFNAAYNLKDADAVQLGMIKNPTQLQHFFNQKPYKYSVMQHAERAAIADAAKRGNSTKDAIMYARLYPCVPCANMIIDAGIGLLVVQDGPDYNDPVWGPQWGVDWKTTEKFLKLARLDTIILGKLK